MRFLTLVFLSAGALAGQPFFPDDPLLREPDPIPLGEVQFRKLNDYYDLFQLTFTHPEEQQPEKGPPTRAQNVNTLDEVPDSLDWFTNRIGAKPLSADDIRRGPGDSRPPADGAWEIVAAKTEGVTPGFRVRDRTGEQYFIKFDPLDHPEMATGADVIGSLLFHALGYNVPENHLVTFNPEQLTIAEGASMPDEKGEKRQITQFDVNHALLRVPRKADGSIRAVASRLLPGKIIGEFRYYGTRQDDYNDIVPHEHRRELRGLFVFAAWLNHNDSRAINDLDSVVEHDGLRYVRHYLIDFGAILGSSSIYSNTARDGNAVYFDAGKALQQTFTLGLYVPGWARAKYQKSPAIGMINWDRFEPEAWTPNYPNPAFDNRLADDEFWAAKKVMAFTDEQIAAAVAMAEYSNPEDTRALNTYLIERRNRIGEAYLTKLLPLDGFHISGGKLEFEDLAVKYGIAPAAEYRVAWSAYDNQTGTAGASAGTGLELPSAVMTAPAGSYHQATVSGPTEGKAVHVWVRSTGAGTEVVGVQRTWPGTGR